MMKIEEYDNKMREEFDQALKIFQAKNRQYGGAFFGSSKAEALKDLQRKYVRIRAIIESGATGESLLDTLADLGNYCFMTRILLKDSGEEEQCCPLCGRNVQ